MILRVDPEKSDRYIAKRFRDAVQNKIKKIAAQCGLVNLFDHFG